MRRVLLAMWLMASIGCREPGSRAERAADGGSGSDARSDDGGDEEEERLRQEQVTTALRACHLLSNDGIFAGSIWFQDVCTTKCLLSADCVEVKEFWCGSAQAGNALGLCLRTCDAEFSPCAAVLQNVPRCDGLMNCPDGSDERDCRYFECTNGQKISAKRRCNGNMECTDGSDEQECGFVCSDGEATNDPLSRCNGEMECADESDERDCIAFVCKDGSGFVGKGQLCNTLPDCEDGSDEMQGCTRSLCD